MVFSIQDSGIQSSMHDIRVDSPDGKGSPLIERRYNPAQYQDEVSVRLLSGDETPLVPRPCNQGEGTAFCSTRTPSYREETNKRSTRMR